jgi:hypothetical protein
LIDVSKIGPPNDSQKNRFHNLPATIAEWFTALGLFVATAWVVIWQNSHLAVLWDLSYVLDHSFRISIGQLPYRDFPFVHAPLTFLVQAGIIKLTGNVYWHHIAYCALAGGAATFLSWRIIRNVLSGAVHARAIALLLTVPLVPLGIYSVFPHPFYDPDCTLAVLVSLLLLQAAARRPGTILLPLTAGVSLVVPLFVKQNTGLPFLLTAVIVFAALAVWEKVRRCPARLYLLLLGGALAGTSFALAMIQLTVRLSNYWQWTIHFAAQRRTPALGEMVGIYSDKITYLWLTLIALAIVILVLNRARRWALAAAAAVLFASPFVWPAIYLWRDTDPSERADRLIGVWPVLLIVAFVAALIALRRGLNFSRLLPLIVIAAVHGCFMSQQLWGSTYGIWPLFMILLAAVLRELSTQSPAAFADGSKAAPISIHKWFLWPATLLIVISLTIAGAFYARSHERLSYANLDDGELKASTLRQLKGLKTRGDWIPSFEELVRYTDQQIPRNDGILLLPGEDPFYYATGRTPQFPVLLFDHTVNPYSPEEILAICRERKIDWVIVKEDLQNEDDPVDEEKQRIAEYLEKDFAQVESLSNYDIYKRNDEADDNDDDK